MRDIILSKLNQMKISYKFSGDHYVMCGCLNPSHNDETPSFHIDLNTGLGGCFTCGFKAKPSYFIDKTSMTEDELEELERTTQYSLLKAKLKREEIGLNTANLPIVGAYMDEYRGLSKDTLDRFDVYLCTRGLYADRVIFPFYVEGRPVGFTSRTTINSTPKYLHSKGFDNKATIYPYDVLEQEATKRALKYVVLVEGVLDCLSLWQNNIPSICNFGVANNLTRHKLACLLSWGIESIYVSFDKDLAGQEAEDRLINSEDLKYLADFGVELKSARELKELEDYYKIPEGDLNDYF